MKVVVNEEVIASVGDIIEFNHTGSHGEGSHYLISNSDEGYFILNLSGKKSNKIKFYKSLGSLIKYHKISIINIYSQTEWNLSLTKK